MTKEEAEIFRNDREIASNLVKSYQLIYEFFGVKIKNLETGEVTKKRNYLER